MKRTATPKKPLGKATSLEGQEAAHDHVEKQISEPSRTQVRSHRHCRVILLMSVVLRRCRLKAHLERGILALVLHWKTRKANLTWTHSLLVSRYRDMNRTQSISCSE